MSLLDKIKAHAEPEKTRWFDVPEWGEGGKPLRIHYTMVTLIEIADAQAVTAEAGGGNSRYWVEIVCMKARDAKGEALFRRADATEMMRVAAPEVVQRIASQMLDRKTGAELEKN